MRKKKLTTEVNKGKVISYTMQPEVHEALSEIMKSEGINTMHKAINACILQRQTMRDSINQQTLEIQELARDRYRIQSNANNLIHALREMDKHTKTS